MIWLFQNQAVRNVHLAWQVFIQRPPAHLFMVASWRVIFSIALYHLRIIISSYSCHLPKPSLAESQFSLEPSSIQISLATSAIYHIQRSQCILHTDQQRQHRQYPWMRSMSPFSISTLFRSPTTTDIDLQTQQSWTTYLLKSFLSPAASV